MPVQHLFTYENSHYDGFGVSFAHRFPHLSALQAYIKPPAYPHHRCRALPPLQAFSVMNPDQGVVNRTSLGDLLLFHCDFHFFIHPSSLEALLSSLRYLRITTSRRPDFTKWEEYDPEILTPGFRAQEARLPNLEELILPPRLSATPNLEGFRSWARESGVK